MRTRPGHPLGCGASPPASAAKRQAVNRPTRSLNCVQRTVERTELGLDQRLPRDLRTPAPSARPSSVVLRLGRTRSEILSRWRGHAWSCARYLSWCAGHAMDGVRPTGFRNATSLRCAPFCCGVPRSAPPRPPLLHTALHTHRPRKRDRAETGLSRPASAGLSGTPDRSRTCDPRFRKAVLYPTELRAPTDRL